MMSLNIAIQVINHNDINRIKQNLDHFCTLLPTCNVKNIIQEELSWLILYIKESEYSI